MRVVSPVPIRHPVGDNAHRDGLVTQPWQRFLQDMRDVANGAPGVDGSASLDSQDASIGATALVTPAPGILGGRYRVSYAAAITRAAGASSSLIVTIGWTQGGTSMSVSSAAFTDNALGAAMANSVLIRPDAGTNVTYATTYASSGSPTMHYSLDVALEDLP